MPNSSDKKLCIERFNEFKNILNQKIDYSNIDSVIKKLDDQRDSINKFIDVNKNYK